MTSGITASASHDPLVALWAKRQAKFDECNRLFHEAGTASDLGHKARQDALDARGEETCKQMWEIDTDIVKTEAVSFAGIAVQARLLFEVLELELDESNYPDKRDIRLVENIRDAAERMAAGRAS